MNELVFATSNPNKILEVQTKIDSEKFPIKIIPVPQPFDPVEDGETFLENAYIKAFEAAKKTGRLSFADDTGLCVEALNGRPGLYSARYAPTGEEKVQKMLSEMEPFKTLDERKAYFTCAIVLVRPDGETIFSCQSKFEGFIDFSPKGSHGFGYDPIFMVKELGKNLAELSTEEKNTVSHRALALKEFTNWLSSHNIFEDAQ
ncbi:MAG: RdgB/HAM1 family non-canonical purine NTP pyrophosphatase [bacterium]|nr:RdgB/HAM1 family non-canonical purine NTP pyrophosphatase [bacterium]